MAYLGCGVYVTSRGPGDEKSAKPPGPPQAHRGGKDLSLWTTAYPSGFQPPTARPFNYDDGGLRVHKDFIADYLGFAMR